MGSQWQDACLAGDRPQTAPSSSTKQNEQKSSTSKDTKETEKHQQAEIAISPKYLECV